MVENKTNKILYYGILVILSAIICYLFYLIISNLNKGFELSDESYYCLATQYPLEARTFASCFGIVNNKLCFGNYDLYSLRIFKFAYQTFALLCFCLSLFFYIKKRFPERTKLSVIGLLMVFITGYANYDYLPATLSYNSWSLICSLLFWAIFLMITISSNKKMNFVYCTIAGFVLTLLFYCKLPNAIILFVFFTGYHLFFLRKTMFNNLLAMLPGILLALFILFDNYQTLAANTAGMFNDMINSHHATISDYCKQLISYFTETLDLRIVIAEIFMIVSLLFIKHKLNFVIGLAGIIINVIISINTFKGNSFAVENDFTFVLFLLVNSLILFLIFRNKEPFHFEKKEILSVITLVCTPVLLALGTNNSLFYTGSQAMIFMVAGAMLFILFCKDQFSFLGLGLFSIYTGVFIICIINIGMISSPYRQTALSDKKLPLLFSKPLNNIYESDDQRDFLNDLKLKMKKNNPENFPVASGFSFLGAIYISESKILPRFWLPDPGYGNEKVEEYFKTAKFDGQKIFLLISSNDAANPGYVKILRENNIDLNNKFRLCDSLLVNYSKEYIYFYKTM